MCVPRAVPEAVLRIWFRRVEVDQERELEDLLANLCGEKGEQRRGNLRIYVSMTTNFVDCGRLGRVAYSSLAFDVIEWRLGGCIWSHLGYEPVGD